jgi:hypothetical protein
MAEGFLLMETSKTFPFFTFTRQTLYEMKQLNTEAVFSFTTSTQHYKV